MHIVELQPGTPVGVMTVSDTRTLDDDKSGDVIVEALKNKEAEIVSRIIVKDDPMDIQAGVRSMVRGGVKAIIITGGTGISSRDVTVEALKFDKELPGFGEIFRMLSFKEVGSRSMASRAKLGIMDGVVVFCLPGSVNAVTLAMNELIIPELGHLIKEVGR